jgi:autotransporter-associated beta strand protein
MPLVSYNAATRTGTGNFTLGTLPNGVVATIVDDPNFFGPNLGLVYLNITSVALPKWDGSDSTTYAKTGDVTSGSFDVVVTNATNIALGQVVSGPSIPVGAVVTGIAGLTITLDQAATATATGEALNFTTPGTADGVWNVNTTLNWVDQVTSANSVYKDPNPVLFDDTATGPTAVTLNSTVNPSEVVFNNSSLVYSLSGTGKISGTSSLSKSGSAALTVSTINDYTGVTTLSGGTTTVASLTNGGVASPLGAASSSPSNLVLAGGTLDYTGGAASIDRGLTITGNSTINSANNISTSGQVLRTAGGLSKTGAGTLTLTNAGPNALGAATVNGGTLVLDGTGGAQTTSATGFSLGGGVNADLLVDSTLNVNGDVNIGTSAGTSTLTLSGASKFTSTNRVMTGMNVAGATGHIMIQNTSQFIMTGGWLSVGQTGGGSMTVKDSGSFTMPGSDFNISDLANSNGTLTLQDNGSIHAGNQSFWGKGAGSSATINISGGTYTTINNHSVANGTNTCAFNLSVGTLTVGGECYWADGGGSTVTVTQTGGTVNMNGGYNPMGRNGTLVWTQSAGTVNSNGWSILGRDGTGNGTLNISGGVFNQTQADRPLMIGEFGIGTLTVSGAAQVNSAGANGLILANEPAGTGTVNLNGGTLTVRRVREGNDGNGGNGGTSTFNFDGGVLKAGTGANANFMSGLNSAVVKPGGAFIDTNGQTVSIGQALSDGGNGFLTKQGAGTLLLNGINSYLGLTTVQTGTLGGTGSLDGPLQVNSGASVNPGASAGTFTTYDSATIAGSYVCEVDGANADKLAVAGTLTFNVGSTLDFNVLAAPTQPVYIIASYGSLSGSPTEVDVPAGFHVEYAYNDGFSSNNIALVINATPYNVWAMGYGLNPLGDGAPGVDKDNDGQNNATEFALGGDPTSGSNNAKIYSLVADSDADGDSTTELLMTIAVRSGTPAFAGSPSPTATMDGMTYTIQGSADLSGFTATVNPASPVTTGLPAAPTGYEYRTFSLNGSNGMPSKGFLRVQVNF